MCKIWFEYSRMKIKVSKCIIMSYSCVVGYVTIDISGLLLCIIIIHSA